MQNTPSIRLLAAWSLVSTSMFVAGCAAPSATQPAPAASAAPAPAPVPQPPAPAPAPVPEPPLVIYYAPDVYALGDSDKALLRWHATRLLADPGMHLTIEPHTDAIGKVDYNMELARMRSVTVMKQLQAFGVPASQLQLVPPARPQPRAKGAKPLTADEKSQSRRVDLSYR